MFFFISTDSCVIVYRRCGDLIVNVLDFGLNGLCLSLGRGLAYKQAPKWGRVKSNWQVGIPPPPPHALVPTPTPSFFFLLSFRPILDQRASSQASRGHGVVFSGKTLYSCSASPNVEMSTRKLLGQPDRMSGSNLRWTSSPVWREKQYSWPVHTTEFRGDKSYEPLGLEKGFTLYTSAVSEENNAKVWPLYTTTSAENCSHLLITPAAMILLWKRVIVNMSDIQGTPRPSSDIWKIFHKHDLAIGRTKHGPVT